MDESNYIEMTHERSLFETLGSLDREIGSHQSAAEALKREAEALLERARGHDRVARELSQARHKLEAIDVETPQNQAKLIAPRKRERRTSLAWQVRQHAFGLISKAGQPLGRGELLDGLVKLGIKMDVANPSQAIGKIMWDAEEFEYKNKGYWIAGKPLPTGAHRIKRYKAPRATATDASQSD